jgi:hypothetical protein
MTSVYEKEHQAIMEAVGGLSGGKYLQVEAGEVEIQSRTHDSSPRHSNDVDYWSSDLVVTRTPCIQDPTNVFK